MKNAQFFTFTLLLISICFLPIRIATAQSANTNSMVRLIYFLPNDRPAQPDRVQALRQLIKDAQEFYADEMQRHGFGRKTFTVETDRDGEPVVHQVHGKFNKNYYYNRFTGVEVWKEFFEHAEDLQHIYFFAIDLGSERLSSGNICGTANVNYFPSNADNAGNVLLPGTPSIRHVNETQGEEVLGGVAAIPASGSSCFERLGLTLHELGHAFGLVHDFREGIHSDYVMAYGATKNRLSQCAAEWLSVSRFFNSNPKPNNSSGTIQLISKPRYSSDGINVRFKVTDADGLYQAQLFGAQMTEPGSWSDYKLFDCKRLNGKTSTIGFISHTLTIEPVDNITLQIIDMNGSITWATFLIDIASLLPPPKVVSIPDPNLAKVVRTQLGIPPRTAITDQTMQRLTRLDATDNQIKNLIGLEYATQLTELDLPNNQIRNIRPLSGLTRLKRLDLDENQIRNITPLTGLTQLEGLYIGGNQINNQGVRLLTHLLHLRRLSLYGNKIGKIDPLANLTKLEGLWLENNKIRDVSPLAGLVNLETLHLKGNPIQDLSPLANLPKLRDVDVEIPQQLVVQVSAGQHPPMYWIDESGTLHRLINDKVENILPNVQNATSLAVDTTNNKLYWTEQTGKNRGRIRGANLDGSNVQILATPLSVPTSIVLDPAKGKLYWTNTSGHLKRVNVNGKQNRALIKNLKMPNNIALDAVGGKLYWTEASGRIRRANIDGSNIEDVVITSGAPLSLIFIEGTVYWTEKTGENRGEIRFISRHDGNVVTRITLVDSFPIGLAFDPVEDRMYWTTSSGTIGRSSLSIRNFQPDFVTGLGTPGPVAIEISNANLTAAPLKGSPASAEVPLPDATLLLANYPNPFNPETWIPYQLATASDVQITIYDGRGVVVRRLNLGHQPIGSYQSRSRAAYWDGTNELGKSVASGIYFYTLTTHDFSATRKMLILK